MGKITIEGKEYEIVKFSKRGLEDNDCLLLKPIKQPTFKVGMRVERKLFALSFTQGMVYRINRQDEDYFYLIGDDGREERISPKDIPKYFTPYEKPEVGDDCFIIERGLTIGTHWDNDAYDFFCWDLGLAFKTREQAEFARERLSKLF